MLMACMQLRTAFSANCFRHASTSQTLDKRVFPLDPVKIGMLKWTKCDKCIIITVIAGLGVAIAYLLKVLL
jgi:hypothetical protein